MPQHIPVHGLGHINMVVPDVRSSMLEYARLFGVTRWAFRHLQSRRHGDVSRPDGNAFQNYYSALGLNGGIGIEVKQPLENDQTVNAEQLDRYGPGVDHFFTSSVMPDGAYRALESDLARRGIADAQNGWSGDGLRYHYVDTLALGARMEIIATEGEIVSPPPDEYVDFAADDLAGRVPLLIERSHRIAVVTDDVGASRAAFGDLLGIADWDAPMVDAGFKRGAVTGRINGFTVDLLPCDQTAPLLRDRLRGRFSAIVHHVVEAVDRSGYEACVAQLGYLGMARVAESERAGEISALFDSRQRLDGMLLELVLPRFAALG